MKTNLRIYAFQYMVFTIFYHSFNTPDVLGKEDWSLCFHEAMLKYMQLVGSGLVKSVFTINHRWEQTQQMCEMRKEIYFSPISMRSWPSLNESCS